MTMPTTNAIPAKGEVLRWARETSGYSITQAARSLGLPEHELFAIERGGRLPPASVFKKMTRLYHQVESVLLLPRPPEPEPLPTDYRTVGGVQTDPSPDTLLAIREARRVQHYVSDLFADDPELFPRAEIPLRELKDDIEEVAAEERARFGITLELQRRWRPYQESFVRWRARTQQLGILVLLKKMPWEDCRGLSLRGEELVPTIVINSEDAFNARIFTLFHEYAHLMIRESGVCLQRESTTPKGVVENWCNSFAGVFLVPTEDLRRSVGALFADLPSKDWTIKHVQTLAAKYRVSRYVMARRLRDLGITDFYDKHYDELRLNDKRPTRESAGVTRPAGWQIMQRLSEVGFATAVIVLDALKGEIIDPLEAADILDLRVEQLPELEQRAEVLRSRDPRG